MNKENTEYNFNSIDENTDSIDLSYIDFEELDSSFTFDEIGIEF